jgi:hypothetical protein
MWASRVLYAHCTTVHQWLCLPGNTNTRCCTPTDLEQKHPQHANVCKEHCTSAHSCSATPLDVSCFRTTDSEGKGFRAKSKMHSCVNCSKPCVAAIVSEPYVKA